MAEYSKALPYASGSHDHIIQVHIADLHFGAIDPKTEYDILIKQFTTRLNNTPFDLMCIHGDIFDKKYPANHPAVIYAVNFINNCVSLCSFHNAALIIIGGTQSHDAGQISLFETLNLVDYTAEIYIVKNTRFVYTKGLKILCIPEEYGKGTAYYENFLKEEYDEVFLHGALVGGYPGAKEENLGSNREPVFSIDSFSSCKGPIIAGHVHNAMCLQQHMYYVSSAMRYRFGEEAPKGYGITVMNVHTHQYHYQFMPIESFIYRTISVKDLGAVGPDGMIKELQRMQQQEGVHYIRLNCEGLTPAQTQILIKYAQEYQDAHLKLWNVNTGNGNIVDIDPNEMREEVNKMDSMMGFLLDENLDPMTKFVMFVNMNEGTDFITVDRLKQILSEP